MSDRTEIYRFPMRARSVDEDEFDGASAGVARGIAGIGEPLGQPPANEDEAVLMTREEHGEKAGRMLDRFISLPSGTLVWTRTADDEFRLGSLTGCWRYVDPRGRFGISNVRPADWLERTFDIAATPAGVVHTFDRGGRNFQRIRDDRAATESLELWRKFRRAPR